MVPMVKVTFKALLDWFVEQNASRWFIDVQASQFEAQEYIAAMSPVTGFIRLNISANATRKFDYDDEKFWFWSKFQGKEIFLEIPFTAIYSAVDPDTGIPNVFPYFEDWGDTDGPSLPEDIVPTNVEVLENGLHRITFSNGHVEDLQPLTEDELRVLKADILQRAHKPVAAVLGSTVIVKNANGEDTELTIPTQEDLDELNRAWHEVGMTVKAEGFTVDANGNLTVLASNIKKEPEPDNVVSVKFGGGEATFNGEATVLNFPGKVEVNVQEPSTLQIGKDSLEVKLRDRRWTVIEGGKQKPEASMPWIDLVYREKLARREATQAAKDKFISSDEMSPATPEIRSDGSTGESSFFPDLDVSKCTWVSKPIPRPDWMTVHKGGKDD